MKIVKKLIAVMAIAAMSVSFVACGSESVKDPAVATVGDITITKSELDHNMIQMDNYLQNYYGPNFKENAQFIPGYNQMLDQNVQQLIGYEIMVMKAKEREDIKVTKDEVDKEITSAKLQFKSEDEFNAALKSINMTIDEYKKSVEKDLYYKKLVEDYQSKVEVKDQDVKDNYDQNIDTYKRQPGATISHILVDSEDKAKEILQKYKDGTSFAELAAQFGTDGTKTKGGSLGYIEYATDKYDADFMAGAKKLGEGEVSDPVKTQFGWHLIKAEGVHTEAYVQPLEEVSETIKESLIEQKTNEAISADVENWKKELTIKTYAENYQLKVPEASASDNANTTDKTSESETAKTSETTEIPDTTASPAN